MYETEHDLSDSTKKKLMARSNTDEIINGFTFLATKIQLCSSVNLRNINIQLENIFRDILNQIHKDRIFRNLNEDDENFTAIDLGDDKNDIAVQVTSMTTRKKVKETITKYKDEYKYKTVIMLYGVMTKPNRTKDFSEILDDKFKLVEWDLLDLIKKIHACESDALAKIQQIVKNDILPQMDNNTLKSDVSASDGWKNLDDTDDIRNFEDKIKAVNNTIWEKRINKYFMDIASGKAELESYDERDVSAMKYRIFEVCQNELLEFCDSRKDASLTKIDIDSLISKYTDQAVEIIGERSKDYKYPVRNRDILRKIVLALIDECYLSFDENGVFST